MGLRYGGKIINDYSAMQGPCPSGYHVPSSSEWVALCGILTSTFGLANSATTMGTYLKMPMAGYRSYDDADTYDTGELGFYWSSTSGDADYSYSLGFELSNIETQDVYYRTFGFSIRCFKDVSVIPTSSWTTLYQGTGSAGVFWNQSEGLISITDGTNVYTIMDKNLGATTVYNQGDTETDANCGYFYQRGNNYGFPHSGTVTTSTTQVDASNYGPGNYYNSSTFILWEGDWSSAQNDNLRGGETGVQQRPAPIKKRYYGGKIVNDYSAMQGPAPSGFHIPLGSEFQDLVDMMNSIGISSDTQGSSYSGYLKIPLAGIRSGVNGTVSEIGMDASLWASSSDGWIFANCLLLIPGLGEYEADFTDRGRVDGFSLRCFKDTPVAPDSSWTNLYGTNTAGIFHNATLGLISIVDGNDIITIADKNLGATTVWNAGDTLTSNNCGNYYQRGNNYGFPFTGTVTTSSTKVDASNYGPGNYYSSSTFIIDSEDGRWSSVPNDNLRGGVTGVQQRPAEVIKVYKGNTLIREKP